MESDPAEEARKSIARSDYQLFVISQLFDRRVPGEGMPMEDYEEAFGYRFFGLMYGSEMTAEDEQLNKDAVEYMKAYNTHISRHVEVTFPNWRDQLKRQAREKG